MPTKIVPKRLDASRLTPQLLEIASRTPQDRNVTPTHLLTSVETLPLSEIGQQKPCTHAEWLKLTALGWSQPRSGRMEKIDKAFKAHEDSNYSVATARKLRTAINNWIRWKGPETWKTSARNKDGIIEKLRIWAFAPGLPTAMSKEEIASWKIVEEARKTALLRLFADKKIALKASAAFIKAGSAAADAKKAGTELKKTLDTLKSALPREALPDPRKGIEAAAQGAKFVKDDLLQMDNLSLDTVAHLKTLIPIDTIVSDFIPFVNIVTGAVQVMLKWKETAKAQMAMSSAQDNRYVIETGDPQKAFEGLFELLARDRTKLALEATQSSVKFAAQTAGTFADLGLASGPALAAANAAATFAHKLFLLGREMKEVNEANKILTNKDNLDFQLFVKYPLAGCYMISCSTTSDILAMSTVMFGNPGWMDDVEQMKKECLDPLIGHCDRFIKESLFEFRPEMPRMKRA